MIERVDQVEVLERELLRPETRADRGRMTALLHPDFVEIGRSGRVWSGRDVIDEFIDGPPVGRISAFDFTVVEVAEDAAMLTYRTAHIGPDGMFFRHAWRSSLWIRSARGWRIRFHQGTPTAPFDP